MEDVSRYIKVTNILCVLFRLFTVATVIVWMKEVFFVILFIYKNVPRRLF